jgi:tetratricopeptide (TPR) repeat protein
LKTILLLLITLFTLCISCKEKSEPTASKEKEFVIPTKSFLSREWVSYHLLLLKERNREYETIQELKIKAKSRMQKGIVLYRMKKDSDAIREYEEAIDLYPLSELYYHYGNSLANLNRLEDSIHAYKISLSISNWDFNDDYSRPELIFYNLACSHSRLNQLDEAYTYLAQAVDRGYNAFAYIEKDPDMENLRKQPDWKEKIQKWRQEYSYNENTVAGLIKEQNPRDALLYYLCKGGIAILLSKDYCVRNEKGIIGYKKGKWELFNGDIRISIKESCLPTYRMSDKEKAQYDFERQVGGGYCKPGIVEFSGDCEFNEYFPLIKREIVKEILKKPTKRNQDDIQEGFSLRKLTKNQEPKQCDPDFVPKTLDDIIIKEIQ